MLISRAVLTDLREHFVSQHVLRTIEDAFHNQGIRRMPASGLEVSGERRQLVEEYYAGLDFTDFSDVQKILRIIERELAAHQSEATDMSSLARVVVGLEQDGYHIDGYRILPSAGTPLTSLQEHLEHIGSQSIITDWERMLAMTEQDPEDAITSARAVVESTCKVILEELGVAYEDKWDLGRLYKEAARVLQLSPQGYHEQVFKQILSGLFSISNGLAEVRNAFGDAHGKGKHPVRATPRHARLAVNTAGTLAVFLVETLEARSESDGSR